MNPLYFQMFNPQYVNNEYYRYLQRQQHDYEQCIEISNAVKAIRDCCDAFSKIDQENQQLAFEACVMEIINKMNENNR